MVTKLMIHCSVCQTENDQYATICNKCGGFLQNRVPNLDLFDTLWGIIEGPRKTFRLIVLAEHKNYSLFLYTFFGIAITYAGFWHFRMGDRFENLFPLIFWGLIVGIPLGIVLCPIVSLFHWLFSKIFGGKATFRISLGIMSYALTPIIISLVLLLPIELLTFGIYLFTFNPHPMTIKPLLYIFLLGFDGILILWAFILAILGTMVGNQLPLWKSVLIIIMLCSLLSTSLVTGGEYALQLF